MKTTVSKRRKMLLATTIALVATATSGVGFLSTPKATAETLADFGGFISYDASQVTVSDGYSPIVGAATATTNAGGKYANGRSIVRLGAMTRQLDNGQNGLLVTSTASGTDAEGAGFSFTNALEGDFSMDFRVFSQETYQGFHQVSAKNGYYADTFNPFLDLKEVGITITSISNPDKAFTISVGGASDWAAVIPQASVSIEGETFTSGNIKGYGILNNTGISNGYGTLLKGTSFVNTSPEEYNAFTSLSVDMETLKVYGVSSTMTTVSSTAAINTENVLIRDLQNNEMADGTSLFKSGMSALNPADFANGYTVSVEFLDVTANDTVVKTATWAEAGSDIWSNATGTALTDSEGNDLAYDRYANMVIYSLNGQSFQKNAGFKIETNTNVSGTAPYHSVEGWTGDVLRLFTQGTGLAGEGTSFDYAGTKTGTFEQTFAVYDWGTNSNKVYSFGRSRYNGGNGLEDDANPCPELRGIAFDFVSVSNPDAKFTLYVNSHNSGNAYMATPEARVAIPGDKIYTTNFQQGYGLNGSTSYSGATHTLLSGAFFGTNINSDRNVMKIKFDAAEMKVYGLVGTEYVLIRDLVNNSGTGVPTDYCASLTASDFTQGYKVTFRVCDVTRNDLLSWTNRNPENVATDLNSGRVYNNNGTLTAENTWAYGNKVATRNPEIWFAGLKTSDIDGLNTSTTAAYNKQQPTAKIAPMVLGEENELKPVFFGVMSNDATVTGDVSFANGSHTGTLTLTDGACTFTPTVAGEYTFTYNVSWNGETIAYETKAVAQKLHSTITFKNGTETVGTCKVNNGVEYTLSEIAPTISLNGYTFVGWSDGENTYKLTDSVTFETDGELQVVKTYGSITGATITLGGEIGVNFYVQLPETATTQTATFAVGGNVVKTVELASVANESNLYKLTYTVAPKDFRTEITLTVNGETAKTYSAEAYLNTVINDTTDAFNAEDKAIAQATFDYCSIASKYFDGVATDVAVTALTENELSALEAYKHVANLDNLPEGIEVLGPRLVLESETAIRLYFSAKIDLSVASVTVNGEEAEFIERSAAGMTVYYVEVTEIAAKDLDETATIVISAGGATVAEISYSALSYVRSALLDTTTDSALVEMVTALYRYNQAANAYFA